MGELMNVFDKLRNEQQAQTQTALADYFRLLATMNPNDPSPADAPRFAEYLARLGRSVAQAEMDQRLVADTQTKLRIVDGLDEATKRVNETSDAFEKAKDKAQKDFAENRQHCIDADRATRRRKPIATTATPRSDSLMN